MDMIYRVVGAGAGEDMSWPQFEVSFGMDFDGIEESEHLRECLQGQPTIKGLCGPMYDGEINGQPVIRYETWAAYNVLSA
jgi:hypothetical protein